jgi:hypothetical protein
MEDLQLDRWWSTKALLANTRTHSLRTSRSQVLAAAATAAKSHAIEVWCTEEPGSADAYMMHARVLTHRVLAAHRTNPDRHSLLPSLRSAHAACDAGAHRWPKDPVFWVAKLALAQLDVDPQRWHSHLHWATHPDEPTLSHGPWPLLWQVDRLDWANREAYHRMLQCLEARGREKTLDFTWWAASRAEPGSPHLVLPLYAYVGDYRLRTNEGRNPAGGLDYWTSQQVRYYARLARDQWFSTLTDDLGACSLLDLNYLAYTLSACGLDGADSVFAAIDSYATPSPWQYVSGDRRWQDFFVQARYQALRHRQYR